MKWDGADTSPPYSFSQTIIFGTDWTSPIDLHDVQVSVGDNYCGSTFTGTVTITHDVAAVLEGPTPTGPYTVEFYVDDVLQGTALETASPYMLDLGVLGAATFLGLGLSYRRCL
ncbi:MAG: hypothetical protein WCP35_16775 [Verrucomicrobiota bacterium]